MDGPKWGQVRGQPLHAATGLSGKAIPPTPGIYVWFKDDEPIYVGKATNLRQRLWGTHLRTGVDLSRSAFRRNVAEFIGVATVAECRIRPSVLTLEQVAKVTRWIAGCQIAWLPVASAADAKSLETTLLAEWKPPLNRADS